MKINRQDLMLLSSEVLIFLILASGTHTHGMPRAAIHTNSYDVIETSLARACMQMRAPLRTRLPTSVKKQIITRSE